MSLIKQGPNGWPLEGGSRHRGRRRRRDYGQRLRRKLVQWYFIHEHQQRFSRCLNGGRGRLVSTERGPAEHASYRQLDHLGERLEAPSGMEDPAQARRGFGYYANTPVVGQDGTIYFQDLGYNVFAADGKCRPRAS